MWCSLPGCAEWKLSTVLTVCRKELEVEVRQPPAVWANVQAQRVPSRLKEFVVAPLWRKLLVVQRLNNFQLLGSVECPLCGIHMCSRSASSYKIAWLWCGACGGYMFPRMLGMSRPKCAQTMRSGQCPHSKAGWCGRQSMQGGS